MSEFRRYWNFIQKPQRDQVSELRNWSDSFSLSPALSQTKSSPAVSVQPANSVTDVRDDAETAAVENYLGDVSQQGDDEVFDFGKEAVDKVFAADEDDHEVLQLIASKEKDLLEIWQTGPAQLTMSQEVSW